jgi:hypothetical protein
MAMSSNTRTAVRIDVAVSQGKLSISSLPPKLRQAINKPTPTSTPHAINAQFVAFDERLRDLTKTTKATMSTIA